jgi:hypothetical protein
MRFCGSQHARADAHSTLLSGCKHCVFHCTAGRMHIACWCVFLSGAASFFRSHTDQPRECVVSSSARSVVGPPLVCYLCMHEHAAVCVGLVLAFFLMPGSAATGAMSACILSLRLLHQEVRSFCVAATEESTASQCLFRVCLQGRLHVTAVTGPCVCMCA